MRTCKILPILILSSLIFSHPGAEAKLNQNVGRTGFGFLKLNFLPRSASLGGASVAADRGEVNPASLTKIKGENIQVSYTNYLLDTQLGFAGFRKKLTQRNAFGIAIKGVSYGDFIRREPGGEQKGSFKAADLATEVGFSRLIMDNLSVGASFRAIYSKIEDYSSDAYTFDFGLLFEKGELRLGGSILNLGFVGSGYSENSKEFLPTNIKFGFSYSSTPLSLFGDYDIPNDNDPYFSLGTELAVNDNISVRVGYKSLYRNSDRRKGLSFGTGLFWKAYKIDYSYTSLMQLGRVHALSVSYKL